MLTEAWTRTPLRYHPQQDRMWRTRARFVAAAAGRGSGKTMLARMRVVRMLAVKKPWPDPVYFYALPTRDQAKRVTWQAIKNLVPAHWVAGTPSESELKIDTIFGSTLYVVGMDKPQRIEGTQWDGGVQDEACDHKHGSFARSILPALTHRKGWCWRIGVPKRFGPGAKDFRAFYESGLDGANDIESYTWKSEDVAPPEEIARAKAILDPRDYMEQYEASWEDVAGLIFHSFDRKLNVTSEADYDPKLPLLVGSDFNVDPMAWTMAQERDGYLNVFDEIWMRNTNTPATLNELHRRYGNHIAGVEFYGDAAGKARKSSATMSDYQWIKADERFKRAKLSYPSSNPARADRFAATNALCLNAAGQRRMRVHPRCKRLIEDLTSRSYVEGSREPDDSGDIGHITDALGYLVWARFPIKTQQSGTTGVHIAHG